LETFEPIPYVDDEITIVEDKPLEPEMTVSTPSTKDPPNVAVVRRGKLDKSYSTPAYGSDNDSGEFPGKNDFD
jgi:hypothetical protein